MTDASLNITLVIEGQTNKETTIATADENIIKATQRSLAVDLTAGHVTLTSTEFTRYFAFLCSGHTALRNLTIPLIVNGADPAPRFFVVRNSGTHAVTVKGSTGATVALPAGRTGLLLSDGADVTLVGMTVHSATPSDPLDLATFWRGVLTSSCLLMRFVAVRALTLPLNLSGSQCKVGTNPTSTAVLTIEKNGSGIGSISINTSGVASFTFAAAVSFAAADILTITGPASADATLADVSVTLMGTRN